MKGSVIILGPGHPLRGGLATFNHRLAKEFIDQGYTCEIYSYSLQYPTLFFPGTSQLTDEPAPTGLIIFSRVNSINPINWFLTGLELKKRKADIVVVRYWLPFMGPALGTILRKIRENNHTRIIAITDNILPHEKRWGDHAFTSFFLRNCDAFVTMSQKVMQDLRKFEPQKPAIQVIHPLYDNFGDKVPKSEARQKLGINATDKVILFFGFIRKYKGLDILLEAMADQRIQALKIKLLIAGEFYEDQKTYTNLIDGLGIKNSLILQTIFIPDQEVKYYLSAADVLIQPYRNATQSGVTPLAYHFEIPMIVSDVGGLPSLVPHEKSGLVTAPFATAVADAIVRFYELGEEFFIPHLRIQKRQYSWANLVKTITDLANDPQK